MLDLDKRESRRYPSIARVDISEITSGVALLKDLSITGCRIEYTMHVEIEENSLHTITIYPEEESGLDKFDLTAECVWTRTGSYSCNIGFSVKKSPRKKDFKKYVDYLSWRQDQRKA